MSDIFISYSRKDSPFARRLFDAIESTGRESWIDWEGIPYSADWWREICTAIDAAENFVFIISPDSLASEICNREVEYAQQNLKRIIPVMYREINEKQIAREWFEKEWENAARENWTLLKKLNWLFFRESDDFDKAFSALVDTSAQDPSHLRLHTRLLVRAREWDTQGREESLLLRGNDLREAENWLIFNVEKAPTPTDLHRQFIAASTALREREEQTEHDRQTRELKLAQEAAENARRAEIAERDRATRFRVAAVVLGIVGIFAVVATIAGFSQARDAQAQVVIANTQVALAQSDQATIEFQAMVSGLEISNERTWFDSFSNFPVYAQTLSAQDVIATATAWAIPLPDTVMKDFDGIQMMLVAAGCFLMGGDYYADSRPISRICINQPFWIDRTEVTNQQFADFGGNADISSYFCDYDHDRIITSTEQKACAQRPRESIDWFEARNFCALRGARLPTEAEWEYAARGPHDWVFPWGKTFDSHNLVYYFNANDETTDVGSRLNGASWVGALDMAGSVQEWVNTIYDQTRYPYPYREDGRDEDNDSDIIRGVRGGSWHNGETSAYTFTRYGNLASYFINYIGFRCVHDYNE